MDALKGYVLGRHLVHQALNWIQPELQKKHGRARMNRKNILDKNLNVIDLTWSEATELVEDCKGWRSCSLPDILSEKDDGLRSMAKSYCRCVRFCL